MNILVVNDDGIEAPGICELARALHERAGARIYVFAPAEQRSGAGHSISLRSSIGVRPAEFANAELAFAVSGTPADCVAVGKKILGDRGIEIDLLFSGINMGSNVGTDTLYSGTVGAAMEGSIQGIPSAAVSVDSHRARHFEYACDLAVDAIEKTGGTWDSDMVININTPDLPPGRIRGVMYTVVGDMEYSNDIQLDRICGEEAVYVYGGEAVSHDGEPGDSDVIAIQSGYASISPLHRDLTAYKAYEQLKRWRIGR